MPHLKSFKTFSEDRIQSVVITFGRFQPPTVGHEKLIEKVISLAKGNSYRIYVSQTHDNKKNPLEYVEKIKFLRKMFPKAGRNIIEDTSVKDIFNALDKMHNQGNTRVTVVVGSDRVSEFTRLLNKYNGVQRNSGFYKFKDGIQIESAGERDPDSDDVPGMSGTKMRDAVIANKFDVFSKGLPKDFDEALELFKAVRVGLGLKESVGPRQHIQLKSVSTQREQFVAGNLFVVGDDVRLCENNECGKIIEVGPNFVVVQTESGKKRKWIDAVTKIE